MPTKFQQYYNLPSINCELSTIQLIYIRKKLYIEVLELSQH